MKLQMERLRRPLIILGIVAGVLIVGAILLGILNATVGKGEWTFGWSGYRYDDSGFSVGNGSVPYENIQKISVDWIDGKVEILPCDDRYISLTEHADSMLTEQAELRWAVSEDGTALTVKYRASSWILGSGAKNLDKMLTLRIPRQMLAEMKALEVTTVSGDILAEGVVAPILALTSDSGAITVSGGEYSTLAATSGSGKIKLHADVKDSFALATETGDIDWNSRRCTSSAAMVSRRGSVTVTLPENASFFLEFKTERGALHSDLPLVSEGESMGAQRWKYNAGECSIAVTSHYGSLRIIKK